jgi:hypothetical protein
MSIFPFIACTHFLKLSLFTNNIPYHARILRWVGLGCMGWVGLGGFQTTPANSETFTFYCKYQSYNSPLYHPRFWIRVLPLYPEHGITHYPLRTLGWPTEYWTLHDEKRYIINADTYYLERLKERQTEKNSLRLLLFIRSDFPWFFFYSVELEFPIEIKRCIVSISSQQGKANLMCEGQDFKR